MAQAGLAGEHGDIVSAHWFAYHERACAGGGIDGKRHGVDAAMFGGGPWRAVLAGSPGWAAVAAGCKAIGFLCACERRAASEHNAGNDCLVHGVILSTPYLIAKFASLSVQYRTKRLCIYSRIFVSKF
jgi:hypothetical protein